MTLDFIYSKSQLTLYSRYGSEQLADGSFVKVPIISGANSDEGTAFSPTGINTTDDLISYLNSKPLLPSLSCYFPD